MSNTTFAMIIFGLISIMFLFVYMPISDSVNLTDEGEFVEGFIHVDSNWETQGILSDDLQTDSNFIYPEANQQGTWTSNLIEGENFNLLRLSALSDTRDGNIEYRINLWSNNSSQTPDETIEGSIDEVDYFEEYEGIEQYDIIEVEFELQETGGKSNKKPNVNEFRLEYVEDLDRIGLGLNSTGFQIFTLFVLIGSIVLALTKSFFK